VKVKLRINCRTWIASKWSRRRIGAEQQQSSVTLSLPQLHIAELTRRALISGANAGGKPPETVALLAAAE